MTQTYLNGRVTISSLAAPSEEDKRIFDALSDQDQAAVINEALARGEEGGVGDRTPEQIWEAAKARVSALTTKNAV